MRYENGIFDGWLAANLSQVGEPMSTRQMHAVPMSFEDWFQREWPHITIDSYDAERIRIGWNAALRYAAGICRDLSPKVDPHSQEDAKFADAMSAVLQYHFGQCAQAIEKEIGE